MKRARFKQGSVVLDRRRMVWNYLYCDNGARRTRSIGPISHFPTKAEAWAEVVNLKPIIKPNVATLHTVREVFPTIPQKRDLSIGATNCRGFEVMNRD